MQLRKRTAEVMEDDDDDAIHKVSCAYFLTIMHSIAAQIDMKLVTRLKKEVFNRVALKNFTCLGQRLLLLIL